MSGDKALQYVGQIVDAYNAAEKAGASALHYALECGKHLCSAFNTVEAAQGKGKWNKWRKKNLPTVSEETERIYRKLARAVGMQSDVFEKAECKSIRDAIKHLSTLDEHLNPKPVVPRTPRTTRTGSSAAGLAPPEAGTPSTDPAVVLAEIDASDIIDNIKGDADKLEEVARQASQSCRLTKSALQSLGHLPFLRSSI